MGSRFDRIDEFLHSSDGPRVLGLIQPGAQLRAQPMPSPQAHAYTKHPSSPTNSSSSLGSGSSATPTTHSGSETSIGRKSSVSSIPSGRLPWQPLHLPLPSLNQTIAMAAPNHGYDLPCECTFLGCNLRFHPDAFEDWIEHSVSHFGGYHPLRAVCTFCDTIEFDCSNNPNDADRNWRRRMMHVAGHFYELRQTDDVEVHHPRPDFWVLEHLRLRRLISPEDYSHATQFSERPHCDHTHPLGWRPPEMLAKEERRSGTTYDLRKEKHQRRKEKEQKSGKTHRH